jgi:CTD small phosphatase-like protein 2
MHFKDLRVIPREMHEMVIVDNSVHSFAFQEENGIPILPWYRNMEDTELLKLIDY